MIHHLLAAYSFGASKEKIQHIFDIHAKDQRPLPPSIGTFTRENFKEHLGKAEAYTSFLQFFESEIEKNGAIDTVRRFVWSGDFLARTVGGLYHPMIHIGYGLEFDIPGIVAEGLSMAACTESHFAKIVPSHPDLTNSSLLPVQAQIYAENYSSTARGMFSQFVDQISSQLSTTLGVSDKTPSNDRSVPVEEQDPNTPDFLKDNQILKILKDIREDAAFDSVTYDNPNKFDTFIAKSENFDRINHYVSQWKIDENTKNIQEKLKELYTAAALLIGATGVRDGYPLRLDFGFAHTLTSIEFVHQYVCRIAPSEAVALIRGHFAITLVYYVVRGRPTFNFDGLLNYTTPQKNSNINNHWLDVFDRSLSCEEAHVIKAVRSCSVGQIIYGAHGDQNLNKIWLNVAQMVCDGDGKWDFDSLGFDESWKKLKESS